MFTGSILSPRLMQPVDQGVIPFQRHRLLLHFRVKRPGTGRNNPSAARRVQVDRLQRPHETPTQTEPMFHQRVQIGRGDHVVRQQTGTLRASSAPCSRFNANPSISFFTVAGT